VLGRLIVALEVDLEIFDEVLKPFLDVELSENIVKPNLNLDDDSPIQKRGTINILIVNKSNRIPLLLCLYLIETRLFHSLFLPKAIAL
jgi:hypothetical protein